MIRFIVASFKQLAKENIARLQYLSQPGRIAIFNVENMGQPTAENILVNSFSSDIDFLKCMSSDFEIL